MSRNFLSEILAKKREAIARLKARASSNRLRERALEIRRTAVPHRLFKALKWESPRLKIIAEFKRKSPSAGTIRDDRSAEEIACAYDRAGACAISVLTDEEFFDGSIADLRAVRSTTNLPVLRKDFIIDPVQVYEIAEDQLGLDALVEVHTSVDMRRALNAGARIIGVNNRNLETFEVSLETSEHLIGEAPPDRIMVSESGLQNPESLRHLQALGFRSFLIGEILMRAPDPETALRDLIHAASDGAELRGYMSSRLHH